ncbi:hypothetical protein [Diaphorobacter sp.]|uniref:hypothetical protein n=1 Tax=Diaphorobacter sp. TaxID=1934310 RepID=UPI0028A6366B|nr:hypothetical protein [Diaphorobacter sp.]
MDVFYYWKNIDQDIKEGRIGWFQSGKEELNKLKARHPNYLWVFKTPPGRKGNLQLFARLAWTDGATTSGAKLRPAGESNIFYDPTNPKSVWYTESDADSAVTEITEWARPHLPQAFTSNFQGKNGQWAIERPQCLELEKIAAKFSSVPFPTGQ